MEQENKDLLLKYLCMALPYGVKIQYYFEDISYSGYFDETVWSIDNDEPFHVNDRWIEDVKPYLRPMSSMTKEEEEEFHVQIYKAKPYSDGKSYNIYEVIGLNINWLLENHFDFMGLIPKGLAIEVNESNNPYESNM